MGGAKDWTLRSRRAGNYLERQTVMEGKQKTMKNSRDNWFSKILFWKNPTAVSPGPRSNDKVVGIPRSILSTLAELPLEVREPQGTKGLPSGNAQFEAAVKLISESRSQIDEDEAVRLLTSSANSGHIQAQTLLGSTLRHRGDIEEAIKWFSKAAEGGDPGAQVELGLVYLQARKDFTKANACWKVAARAGDGVAFANLGMLYANGLGVERSPTRAVLLISTAMFVGNEPAKRLLEEVSPTLIKSPPSSVQRMAESLKKLDALAASGDRETVCRWVIDNLEFLA
jgi:TPR repeat protein